MAEPPPLWEEPTSESSWLSRAEMTLVMVLAAICAVVLLYLCIWIVAGHWFGNGCHARLVETIRLINDNWKAGALILVVLFFRPVRRFLMNVKKAGPLDTSQPAEPPSSGQTESYSGKSK